MYVSDVCQVYLFLVYVQCASIVSGWLFGTFVIFPYVWNSNPN